MQDIHGHSHLLHVDPGTIFHEINVLGAEAEYEPLSLSDFNESPSVDT